VVVVLSTMVREVMSDSASIHDCALYNAVATLYADRVTPTVGVLRRRVAELYSTEISCIELEFRVEGIERLVTCGEPKNRSVCIIGEAEDFVDPLDASDPYPASVWKQLKATIDHVFMKDPSTTWSGGRYGCARTLHKCNFLSDYSLGEVAHIVQLAISQKILGYVGGSVVPFAASLLAKNNRRGLKVSTGKNVRTLTIEDIKRAVAKILAREGPTDLSRMTGLIEYGTHMSLDLSVFGCTKISDLLRSDALAEVCCLRFVRDNQLSVCPAPVAICPPSPPRPIAVYETPTGACETPSPVKRVTFESISPSKTTRGRRGGVRATQKKRAAMLSTSDYTQRCGALAALAKVEAPLELDVEKTFICVRVANNQVDEASMSLPKNFFSTAKSFFAKSAETA